MVFLERLRHVRAALVGRSFSVSCGRGVQRDIVLHVGPTNSGKTYAAMQSLRAAATGAYAGPLRLLAWEIHDELKGAGLRSQLVTGIEKGRVR